MTLAICRQCHQPYVPPDPTIEAKWTRNRPESAGLCLSCISQVAGDMCGIEEAPDYKPL